MAADDDTQDAVRRILKERPPEDLPSGAEKRLRQRLDKEPAARRAARTGTSPVARTARTTLRKKKPKAVP